MKMLQLKMTQAEQTQAAKTYNISTTQFHSISILHCNSGNWLPWFEYQKITYHGQFVVFPPAKNF